jgi:hypothetical protein
MISPFLFYWNFFPFIRFEMVGTFSKIPAPLICDISGLFVLSDTGSGVFY